MRVTIALSKVRRSPAKRQFSGAQLDFSLAKRPCRALLSGRSASGRAQVAGWVDFSGAVARFLDSLRSLEMTGGPGFAIDYRLMRSICSFSWGTSTRAVYQSSSGRMVA